MCIVLELISTSSIMATSVRNRGKASFFFVRILAKIDVEEEQQYRDKGNKNPEIMEVKGIA